MQQRQQDFRSTQDEILERSLKTATITSGILFWLAVIGVGVILLLGGCTLSVGAEGRAFYPKNDPRQGYFETGNIDGIFSTGGAQPTGFATLGGNQ